MIILKDPERYKGLFVFTVTTIIMTVLGLWLAWVKDTGRWHLFAIYCAVLGFVIWKFWDYREPD